MKAKIEKINRRCERFGWPLVDAEFGEPYECFYQDEITGVKTYYNRVEVTINTPPVGFDGWRFIATLENVGGKNIMSAVPGETVPDTYRTAPSKCDHCKADRDRNNTYVLAHEDGTHKQVGSTCINDFLNGHDALMYARIQSSIAGLFAMGGDIDPDDLMPGEGGPRVSLGVDLLAYMGEVATVIRVDGWMSKGRAYELGMFGHSTAETANNLLDPKFWSHLSEEKKAHYASAPEDMVKAKDVIEWLRSDHFDPDMRRLSDYEWNLSVAVGEDYVAWKHQGIVASAFACYDRFRGIQAEIKRSKQQSDFVGEVKERLTLVLTVDIKRAIESDYGVSMFYVMHDADGNKFICFYSGYTFEADEEDTIKVKGTVKKHELDRNGVKQTVLTRIAGAK
jgi:hypothetical protein